MKFASLSILISYELRRWSFIYVPKTYKRLLDISHLDVLESIARVSVAYISYESIIVLSNSTTVGYTKKDRVAHGIWKLNETDPHWNE